MNSKKHSLLSGEKAVISTKVSGKFTAWNGHITGFNLALKHGLKLSRPGAPRVSGLITTPLPSLKFRKAKTVQFSASRKSACRRTDTAAITAVGSRRTERP
jgi:hypothetical protein